MLTHGIAEAVIAQGGDVVNAADFAQLTAQVHRGVQGVTAEALVQAAIGAVLQFDHAFADEGDAGVGVHGKVLRCAGGPHRGQARLPHSTAFLQLKRGHCGSWLACDSRDAV